MQIDELIKLKISEGDKILLNLDSMHSYKDAVWGIDHYNKDEVESYRNQIIKWQLTSKEILISKFGETHRYLSAFEETITKNYSGYNYQSEFKTEVNKGLSVLESIHDSLKLNLNTNTTMNKNEKTPMVFISHSSMDKDFAEKLVTLLEDLGLDSTNIFCSSVNGYGISLGKDIFGTLLSLFEEHKLFVLFIHSPRYYMSPVSLNEMGAAWVLKTDFCSLLTSDMEFNEMKGVVNKNTISIKVDSEDAPARLNELKDKLVNLFNLKQIDATKWERKRKDFLAAVNNISYTQKKKL